MEIPSHIHPGAIDSLLNGDHGDPFALLGPHQIEEGKVSIRAFCPTAKSLTALYKTEGKGRNQRKAMSRLHEGGFFEITLDADFSTLQYELEETSPEGEKRKFHDPYAFLPLFSEFDLHLLSEGRHFNSYEKLGAHLAEVNGVKGVHFAVWAPNAFKVAVVGQFNNWDNRNHPMRRHETSGIWELFIPGLEEWTLYKYEIRSREAGYRTEKSDPYGFFCEMRPRTASVVVDLNRYRWGDDKWMNDREQRSTGQILNSPMSIYEVHLGSWRRKNGYEWLTYRELADTLVDYVKDMNYTHIELMPVAEHPLDASWGYQVTGYYSPTSRFGIPDDFMYLVDRCHQYGIGVILDWAPAHFPKDGFALSYFDGTHLYEHADPRKGEHPDWGTYIFNYGRNEVRNFLISNAIFWLKKYHIDGLRVDAVSSMLYLDFGRKDGEWLPNQYGSNENLEAISFLQEANAIIHEQCPGTITIAEESTAWGMVSRPTYLGGLGFTLKWDMGWMHDTLKYVQKDPIYRKYHHNQITFSMMYAFSENFVLSLSHDEVVHGKGSLMGKIPGHWWEQFATMKTLYGYLVTHPGKILTFMGMEFGQFAEWSEQRSLDWHLLELPTHKALQSWVRDLNRLYQEEAALYEQDINDNGFQWIEPNDYQNSIYSYVRYAKNPDTHLVVVLNFAPVPRENYCIGVPGRGFYKELLNSDSTVYGGSNFGNFGGFHTDNIPAHGHGQSLNMRVPPLGCVIMRYQPPDSST